MGGIDASASASPESQIAQNSESSIRNCVFRTSLQSQQTHEKVQKNKKAVMSDGAPPSHLLTSTINKSKTVRC